MWHNVNCQIELSNPSDGYLHVGDAVCLLHVPSKSVVAAYMSAGRAHEATKLTSPCSVACSRKLHPCPRNVFIVGRYVYPHTPVHCERSFIIWNGRYDKPDAAAGEIVCYGQQITFTTLPDEGGQVSPTHFPSTYMRACKQHAHYKCAWFAECNTHAHTKEESVHIAMQGMRTIYAPVTRRGIIRHLANKWWHACVAQTYYLLVICTSRRSSHERSMNPRGMPCILAYCVL